MIKKRRNMKHIVDFKIVVLFAWITCLFACNEDKGNYTYVDINRVDTFKNISDSYIVELGEHLKITPELKTSFGNSDDFDYAWYYNAGSSWNLLQEGKNLDINIGDPISAANKTYTCAFEAVNRETKVAYRHLFSIKVAGDFGRGYVLLSETETGFDMSMIVLNAQKEFVPKLNILEATAPSLQREGVKPYGIYIFSDPTAPDPYNTDGSKRSTYLLTDHYSTRLKTSDFSWKPSYDISNVVEMGSPLYKDYVAVGKPIIAEKMEVGYYYVTNLINPHIYIYMGDAEGKKNWYMYSTHTIWNFLSFPMNDVRTGHNGTQRYEPAPFLATGSQGTVFYNTENNKLYYQTMPATNDMGTKNLFYTDLVKDESVGHAFNFSDENAGLLYMGERCKGGNSIALFAILKQADGSFKYIEFNGNATSMSNFVSKGNKLIVSKLIGCTGIDNAKFVVVSPNGPFLYYVTKDNKVYYVDISNPIANGSIDITNRVLSEGYNEITAFKFVMPSSNGAMSPIEKALGVATYNSSLGKNTGGRIDFYLMSATSGVLEKAAFKKDDNDEGVRMSWTGFGKIVDLDYKPQ